MKLIFIFYRRIAEWYQDEFSDPYVRLYTFAKGDVFILMDDIVRPRRVRLVHKYLAVQDIERIDNSKQRIYDYIERQITALSPY